jgi:hypothetical protein
LGPASDRVLCPHLRYSPQHLLKLMRFIERNVSVRKCSACTSWRQTPVLSTSACIAADSCSKKSETFKLLLGLARTNISGDHSSLLFILTPCHVYLPLITRVSCLPREATVRYCAATENQRLPSALSSPRAPINSDDSSTRIFWISVNCKRSAWPGLSAAKRASNRWWNTRYVAISVPQCVAIVLA